METIETIDPRQFRKLIVSVGVLPTSFIDSMSYYEMIAWLVKFIKTNVITTINNHAAALDEIQKWIEDLDIQDEVDHKLEEMAESGQLAEIIAEYLNTKAELAFATVPDMKLAENLRDGSLLETYGRFEISDGEGQLYVVRPVTNSDTIDEINIIALVNHPSLVAELVPTKLYTTIEANKLSDDTDDTLGLQRAVATNKPIKLKKNTYQVSSSITINYDTTITGLSKCDSIINYTGSDDALFILSGSSTELNDAKTSVNLSKFKAIAKRFVRVNDNTLTGDNWRFQTSWLGLNFKQLWLRGSYEYEEDSNADTDTLPALGDLLNAGAAFNCGSLFDSVITECVIEHYGVAFYGKGCDLNLICQNRLSDNAIAIRLDRESTYGSQNRIEHNDIVNNHRSGAITINGTKFDSIIDNYFEQYSDAALFIRGIREHGLLIDGNRFDAPTNDRDVIDLAPVYSDIIVNNRVNPGSSRTYINVSHTNFDFIYLQTKTTAFIHDNNEGLRLRNNVGLNTVNFNQLKISPYNMVNFTQNITGTGFHSPYFVLDTDRNLYYFSNTTAGSIIFIWGDLLKYYGRAPKIQITCANTTNASANMYVLVKGDGTQIHGANHAIPADDEFYSFTIDLSSGSIYDQLSIEIPTTVDGTMKIYSIELL